MKKLILTLGFLAASLTPLHARTDPVAQQLLIAAERQADLFSDQTAPFQLEVDFLAQINVPTKGHMTLKWAAKDRWWSKVVMGPFEEIKIRNGDRVYTSRNIGFTPIHVTELTSLLHFSDSSEALIAKKPHQRFQDGVEATCLQVQHENVKEKPYEVCIDPASHRILSQQWRKTADELRTEHFTDYFDFNGHRYPRQLQLRVNGIESVTADVISLTSAPFDESLLVPPPGAVERRHCPGLKQPVPLKTPAPVYPDSAGRSGLSGDVTVALTVLTDGSIANAQVIGRAGNSMDDAALQTVKSWKFNPAMCGADPVVSDITVVVSFRLRPIDTPGIEVSP
jgi:protein TonB